MVIKVNRHYVFIVVIIFVGPKELPIDLRYCLECSMILDEIEPYEKLSIPGSPWLKICIEPRLVFDPIIVEICQNGF